MTLAHTSRSVMASRAEPPGSLDYFPTPPWATRALVEVVLPHVGVNQITSAWEPACGEGHIAEVLREYCPNVTATDIFDYGYGGILDFLCVAPPCCPDWIITNPPFGERAIGFASGAFSRAPNVAMFFRSQWAVEGIDRYNYIFRHYPPTLCAFFVERVPLCKGRWDPDGSTATAYCWLIWMRGILPVPPFWIPPGQRERLTRPDDRERFTTHPVMRRTPEELAAQPSIGEPAGSAPLIRSGEGEPTSDPGFSAGSPMDDSELDIPDKLKRDASNRASFHRNTGAVPPLCDREAPVNSAVESTTAPAALSSPQEA